jgi:predicted O-linked N-acetylglucosamine transferase (SPINDLY family)
MGKRPDRDGEQVRAATAHYRAGRMDQALAAARKVLARSPGQPQANQIVATILARKNMVEQALYHADRAAAAAPEDPVIQASLGQIRIAAGRFEDALGPLDRAIELDPSTAAAHIARGTALQQLHRYEESIASIRRALEIDPQALDAWVNLATAQLELARADDAVETLRQAVRLAPENPAVWTLLCPTMNYASGIPAEDVYAAHRRYGALIEKGLRDRAYTYPNTRDPERVLRVGYLSRDMRRHSCAYFLLPILQSHDPQRVESYCYSHSRHVDDMTGMIRDACTVFRDCATMGDGEIRRRIEADRIDILVELAGHSALHKLPLMARRPAPVQATYLGYPHTTGLQNVQYRLVDARTDPPDAPAHASEELWRLPRCFLAYAPPEVAPEPASLPSGRGAPFTFGSFNEAKKISNEAVALWARVLEAVPDARLLLKAGSFEDPSVRERIVTRFAAAGIDPDRIEVVARIPSLAEHLAFYGRVDLALDTFPYHGTTTTCEAMWMGVPTVTLRGDRHASRVGASLNHAAGLDELTADSHDAFVAVAAGLAADRARLADLRRGLRERMRASPLCDHVAFTRDLEHAYRVWWHRWCEAEG